MQRLLLVALANLCLWVTCPCATITILRGQQAGDQSARSRKLPSRMYEEIKFDECALYRLPPLEPQNLPDAKGKNGRLQTGVVRSLPPDLAMNVRWFDLGARGHAAVLGIMSTGAVAVRVHFADVQLAPDAQIFVRSLKNSEEIYGPYEGREVSSDGSFWTPPVAGEGIVIEYFDPAPRTPARADAVPFRIIEVSHEFRD